MIQLGYEAFFVRSAKKIMRTNVCECEKSSWADREGGPSERNTDSTSKMCPREIQQRLGRGWDPSHWKKLRFTCTRCVADPTRTSGAVRNPYTNRYIKFRTEQSQRVHTPSHHRTPSDRGGGTSKTGNPLVPDRSLEGGTLGDIQGGMSASQSESLYGHAVFPQTKRT